VIRARDVLGPGSALSHILAGWEHREGQLAMAEAVEDALEGERHLFVEAGTGTGKTLAYLVPAILSGRKVIVSTATRALQEQIFVKDLPLVASALKVHGIEFTASMMKGLTNYVCLRRMNEARSSATLATHRSLARVVEWAATSATGDRAELGDLPEDAEIWRDVVSSSETRIGAPCEYFDACFVTRMRRDAERAQVVVVNHHLFLADLALRSGAGGARAAVLPPYDAAVFDEAHQLEDIATDFFGMRVSSARVETLARDAERSFAAAGALKALTSGPLRSTLEGVKNASRELFVRLATVAPGPDSRRIFADTDLTPSVRDAKQALDVRLEALEAIARARPEEALQLVARRAGDLRDDLRLILAPTPKTADEDPPSDPDKVRWIDIRTRSVSIGASPVDVGSMLRERLFDRVPSVVCTSATLATGRSFHFAKARLGAPPESRELVVPSPFDFAAHALLYIPDDLPEPAAPDFEDAAAARIADLVRMTDGGAFVLCTSTRAMKALHARLREAADRPVLVQGEGPKHLILSRFRASTRAVLVATMSFWEGVDVPGRALRLVVIDKIPFAPPNDPVVLARCARIDREGGSGFAQYSVPSAAMMLKQGFGRLIRTQNDAGAVVILDGRILRRGYGRTLLASLPPARRARTLAELRVAWTAIVEGAIADEIT
jgi:ATP-dependent DNA helicase DinG